MLVPSVPWDSTNREKIRRPAEHVLPIELPSQPEPATMRTVVSTHVCGAAGEALEGDHHTNACHISRKE